MARIRTIKPEFWEDEKIARLSMPCRLFFIGTWNLSDDNGVFRASTALLKSKIFPYDDRLRVSEVQKYIDALVEARMLVPISYNCESYYVIRTFHSHQKFDARYPNYLIDSEILKELILKEQEGGVSPASPQRVPMEHSPREGEGKGREEGGGNTHTQAEADFQKFQNWIIENAPTISKMKEPFTIQEFERLKADFDVGLIQSLLKSMHNYKPLLLKNQSANLTFRNWEKRENAGKTTIPVKREDKMYSQSPV